MVGIMAQKLLKASQLIWIRPKWISPAETFGIKQMAYGGLWCIHFRKIGCFISVIETQTKDLP